MYADMAEIEAWCCTVPVMPARAMSESMCLITRLLLKPVIGWADRQALCLQRRNACAAGRDVPEGLAEVGLERGAQGGIERSPTLAKDLADNRWDPGRIKAA
jgi:hypothetical protein